MLRKKILCLVYFIIVKHWLKKIPFKNLVPPPPSLPGSYLTDTDICCNGNIFHVGNDVQNNYYCYTGAIK